MDSTIQSTKSKVIDWLKIEGFAPEERTDPRAYFNIQATISGMSLHVVQPIGKLDSIFVGANMVLTLEQQELLRKMGKEKRREFFWDLRLALLTSQPLGDFQIKPNPPEDVREVFISSKGIYYEALNKDRLISTLNDVLKYLMMVIWLLERTAGAPSPKDSELGMYG
jgi:hypothetical protein